MPQQVVSLASPDFRNRAKRESWNGERHCRSRRDVCSKVSQGSKTSGGARAEKRGGKAKPGLSSDDDTPVLIVRDRHGNTTDCILADLNGETFSRALKPVVAHDALLVSDGRAAYSQFADQAGILHISLNASKGERTYESYPIQNVNAYISRLKGWLPRSKSDATHDLPTYLGWRRMIDREDKLAPEQIVMQAI